MNKYDRLALFKHELERAMTAEQLYVRLKFEGHKYKKSSVAALMRMYYRGGVLGKFSKNGEVYYKTLVRKGFAKDRCCRGKKPPLFRFLLLVLLGCVLYSIYKLLS